MEHSVDRRSKLLFNNVHMLRVASAIAALDEVWDAKALQSQLDLGQSSVHRVLVILEGVDLVERLVRTSRTDSLRFQRLPHPFWAAVSELADA